MEESSAELPEGPHALAAMAPAMAPADILGLSCRFPESGNASEFWSNLVAGRDMVTSDDRRWPVGLHGTPPRSGKVPDYEKFDASFFAVHGKQAQVRGAGNISTARLDMTLLHDRSLKACIASCSSALTVKLVQKMDPQMRKLLEVSWEAWMDAGVDVNKLRGSERVGVYIGCCGSEVQNAYLLLLHNVLHTWLTLHQGCLTCAIWPLQVHAAWLADVPNITGYEQTGCTQSMFANRLSWTYDFRGPSKAVDTGSPPPPPPPPANSNSKVYLVRQTLHVCVPLLLASRALCLRAPSVAAACSSSALALHDAIADLTAGRCDYAMVGGASSILRPATSVAFNKLHMLSPDGACKSFSAAANG